jgi:hypothetical protein
MRLALAVAAILVLTVSAHAADSFECYVSAENPDWTLSEETTKLGRGLIWMQGRKRIELSTGGMGTGTLARAATEEESGEIHTYLYVRGVLVFDMVPYEPAWCPGDRTWVDKDCKRVLISQGKAWSDLITYYFVDADKPVTTCQTAVPPQQGHFVTLECDSGRKIRLDSRDFLTATVDGIEMRVFDGPLPCSSNFGQPAEIP